MLSKLEKSVFPTLPLQIHTKKNYVFCEPTKPCFRCVHRPQRRNQAEKINNDHHNPREAD